MTEYVTGLRQLLLANKSAFARAFTTVGMEALPVPAAYYMLLKHNRASDMAAVDELLERGVAAVPLSLLMNDTNRDTGHVRVHFAVRPETTQAVVKALS